ncbi:DUF397 domain-containing protein [Streptomyces sp. NPDC020379]|uniref:DUF397 domain-containing protein n=1 Tax=Streptomyces sp. NPDC020379 TaxID=3365071 RepID=UPI003792212A
MTRAIPDASILAVQWMKSKASGQQNNCVEVAFGGGSVYIRDSKSPAGPALPLSLAGFVEFIESVRTEGSGH